MRSSASSRLVWLLASTALLATACSSASSPVDDSGSDASTRGDSGTGGDASAMGDGAVQRDAAGSTEAGPAAPTCSDGVKNEGESDVDCGGDCPPCALGKSCATTTDCADARCIADVCSTDTDVGCGGPSAPACGTGKACEMASDCVSLDCKASVCLAATDPDKIQNEQETDIDCGGPNAPACIAGDTCLVNSDCVSLGCNEGGVCATQRSCIYTNGGSTCGAGETGTAGAKNDDCCAELPLTMSSSDPTEPSKKIKMDKYFITAGRFRAMMDATKGDLQSVVNVTPTPVGWNEAWTASLPTGPNAIATAYDQMGPYDDDGTPVNGCDLSGSGNHTYWMPRGTYPEEDAYNIYPDHTITDRMPMNCAPLYYFAAMCVFDGGRIATVAELQRAWRGKSGAAADSADATNEYPWGSSATPTDITDHAIDWNDTGRDTPLPARVYEPSVPPLPLTAYDSADINEAAILPPGRSPQGAGPYGHMDLMGLLLVFPAPYAVGTTWYYDFIGTSDFNNHTLTTNSTVPSGYLKRGVGEYRYWAVGARCVHDE